MTTVLLSIGKNLQREIDNKEEELFAISKELTDLENKLEELQSVVNKVNDPITDIDVKEFK